MKDFDFVYLKEVLFTFRGREANHALSNNAWLSYKWVYGIYEENIFRIFLDDMSKRDAALKYLQQKKRKSQIVTLLQAVAKKNVKLFDEGINIIKLEKKPLLLTCFFYISKSNLLKKIFVIIISNIYFLLRKSYV